MENRRNYGRDFDCGWFRNANGRIFTTNRNKHGSYRKKVEIFYQNSDNKKMMREEIVSRNADFIEAFQISPDDADAFADILMAE